MDNRSTSISTELEDNTLVAYLYEDNKLITKLSSKNMTVDEVLNLAERFKEGSYTPNLLNE